MTIQIRTCITVLLLFTLAACISSTNKKQELHAKLCKPDLSMLSHHIEKNSTESPKESVRIFLEKLSLNDTEASDIKRAMGCFSKKG